MPTASTRARCPSRRRLARRADFYFVEIADPEEGVPKIIQMIKERMPRRFGLDPMKDIQVLCPMNRGVLGARNLNIQLQEVLNPNPSIQGGAVWLALLAGRSGDGDPERL